MKKTLALAIGLVLAFGAWNVADAQVVTTGVVRVVVTDADGNPLPGVAVVATSDETVTTRSAYTAGDGVAVVSGLAPDANYVVTTELDGFASVERPGVLVRSGQTTELDIQMELSGVEETITVTSQSPLVDTRSATTGQDITLQLTESVPTGRTYQSYLQLVPGVMPDNPEQEGNPAAKSGLNYRDVFGENGISRDNFYYIDGINVTDNVTGTFGANLNTEIIQEQKVLTGGIPAEYAGAPGLLSSVITKSGSNTYHGSVNYFFQNDSLVGENQNAPDSSFSTFDAAATLGGPIVRDRAWFFGSYRRVEREDDVVALDTLELLRTVNRTSNQGYARGTVSPRGSDTLSFTFLNDPLDATGRRDRDIVNNRDRRREQGGNNYSLKYNAVVADELLLDFGWNKHNGEVSDFPVVDDPENDVVYRASDDRTLEDEQRGGFNPSAIDQRDTEQYRGAMQWARGDHSVKAGFEYAEHTNFQNEVWPGSPPAEYVSLAPHLAGTSLNEIVTGSFSQQSFNPFNASDFSGLFEFGIDPAPNSAEIRSLLDLNSDGNITMQEVADAVVLSSTEGNPHGTINYTRDLQVQQAPQETSSEGITFYVQDTFSVTDRLVIDAGLRAERLEHFASTGENIYTFDWTWAPRVSGIYDLFGDGQHKLTAYYGIYFDPIRNNMTNFAGSLTGSVLHEQVFINGEWLNFRIRGGQQQADALFAPTTQTPYTDDLQFGYEVDLGRNMSFQATYTKRRTRDVLEDYDMSLYAFRDDGTTAYPGPVDHPDTLFLGLDYFGYDSFPDSNFVIATLAGGKRDYQGIELVYRKRFSNNWQALASYNWNDMEGNSNSDSNADFQGDVIWLDPRAPNQLGRQPGLISHLLKFGGSYSFDFGLELGGSMSWNSGTVASRTFEAFSRHLPVLNSEQTTFAGITRNWLDPDAVGSLENPSYGIISLRAQYQRDIADLATAEFFLDVFNVTDNQDAIRNLDLEAGQGQVAFGEGILFPEPRRLYLGTRLSF